MSAPAPPPRKKPAFFFPGIFPCSDYSASEESVVRLIAPLCTTAVDDTSATDLGSLPTEPGAHGAQSPAPVLTHNIYNPSFLADQVLMMRAVSVSVTVLPDASPVCRDRFEVSAYQHGCVCVACT